MAIPKRHSLVHLVQRSECVGNPTAYDNWLDERLNKQLKACCRGISQINFEGTVLRSMKHILLVGDLKRKRSEAS